MERSRDVLDRGVILPRCGMKAGIRLSLSSKPHACRRPASRRREATASFAAGLRCRETAKEKEKEKEVHTSRATEYGGDPWYCVPRPMMSRPRSWWNVALDSLLAATVGGVSRRGKAPRSG